MVCGWESVWRVRQIYRFECRAKRRELGLSSASEGNRDGRAPRAVMEAGSLQISCDGEFTAASARGGYVSRDVSIIACVGFR